MFFPLDFRTIFAGGVLTSCLNPPALVTKAADFFVQGLWIVFITVVSCNKSRPSTALPGTGVTVFALDFRALFCLEGGPCFRGLPE
jgi:hypothetical protein